MLKLFIIFFSMIFILIGITTILSLFNLLVVGYTFKQYIHFISKDIFCWCLPIGILLLVVYLLLGGKK